MRTVQFLDVLEGYSQAGSSLRRSVPIEVHETVTIFKPQLRVLHMLSIFNGALQGCDLTFRSPSQSVVRLVRPLNLLIRVDPPRAGNLGCSSSRNVCWLETVVILIMIRQESVQR
jgi:hypothetical protein